MDAPADAERRTMSLSLIDICIFKCVCLCRLRVICDLGGRKIAADLLSLGAPLLPTPLWMLHQEWWQLAEETLYFPLTGQPPPYKILLFSVKVGVPPNSLGDTRCRR